VSRITPETLLAELHGLLDAVVETANKRLSEERLDEDEKAWAKIMRHRAMILQSLFRPNENPHLWSRNPKMVLDAFWMGFDAAREHWSRELLRDIQRKRSDRSRDVRAGKSEERDELLVKFAHTVVDPEIRKRNTGLADELIDKGLAKRWEKHGANVSRDRLAHLFGDLRKAGRI
jgi:hypothetical protein